MSLHAISFNEGTVRHEVLFPYSVYRFLMEMIAYPAELIKTDLNTLRGGGDLRGFLRREMMVTWMDQWMEYCNCLEEYVKAEKDDVSEKAGSSSISSTVSLDFSYHTEPTKFLAVNLEAELNPTPEYDVADTDTPTDNGCCGKCSSECATRCSSGGCDKDEVVDCTTCSVMGERALTIADVKAELLRRLESPENYDKYITMLCGDSCNPLETGSCSDCEVFRRFLEDE